MEPTGLIEGLLAAFTDAAGPVALRVERILPPLALLLFAIQLAWDGVRWALAGEGSFAGKLATRLVTFAFLFSLITHSRSMVPRLFDLWEELSAELTGLPGLSPTALVLQGIDLMVDVNLGAQQLVATFIPGGQLFLQLTGLVFFLAFALLAYQLAKLLIESALALGPLMVYLAFGTNAWTFDLAAGYLRYVLHLLTRFLVVAAIVAITRELPRQWEQLLEDPLNLLNPAFYLVLFVTAFIWAVVTVRLPRLVADQLVGGFSLSGHNPMGQS